MGRENDEKEGSMQTLLIDKRRSYLSLREELRKSSNEDALLHQMREDDRSESSEKHWSFSVKGLPFAKPKYRNRRSGGTPVRKKSGEIKMVGGFPSRLEAAVYSKLLERQLMGEIKDIERQQTVVLIDGPPDVRIAWKLDFKFTEVSDGSTAYAEAKGFATEDYKLKLKLWRFNPPGRLYIYKGDYDSPFVAEIIEPK